MRELSLNILDVAQNSISAGASLIELEIRQDTAKCELLIGIYDNGCGMTQQQLDGVTDPFFTTRTTRKVGMGVPLFKMAAEMTGGCFDISSVLGEGTRVTAIFKTDSIDFTPLGDVASTLILLITMNTDRDFLYRHSIDGREFVLDTREIKSILGGVPLDDAEVTQWMKEYIAENTQIITTGKE